MERIDHWLQRLEDAAATLLVTLLTVTIAAQIIFRYFLNAPLAWSEELSQFILICLSFVAATAVLKRSEHYSIDAFVGLLPSVPRRAVEAVALLVQIGLVAGLAYYSFRIASVYIGTTSLILRIPEEIKAYVMAYCFLSMALHLCLRLARVVKQGE